MMRGYHVAKIAYDERYRVIAGYGFGKAVVNMLFISVQ